jgi:UDP-N-acetylglucosamine--N-acetylmuramyl-(pentapeptide) pyrophosphoryl-undecaprenol N-acetylglucosamine transferase
MSKSEREGYVIAGGGTGGHVFPALALAGEIRSRRPEAPIVFVGTRRGLEVDLVPRAGFALEFVRAQGLVGKSFLGLLSGTATLPLSFLDSFRILDRHRPRAVVGVGGYASGPVVATAWARRTPSVIHESNAVPGVTNRILARLATRVVAGTEAALAQLPSAIVVGNPVRPEFFAASPLDSRAASRPFRVLVVGGSQGAAILNRLVPAALIAARAQGIPIDVVHQAGRAHRGLGFDRDDLQALYERSMNGGAHVQVREFLDDMPAEFASADLIISRSGAMSVAEIAAAGRPSLLIPFAAATHGHQEANARALERAGAAVVLTEGAATSEAIAALVTELLASPERLCRMGLAARTLSRRDAAVRFCDVVFDVETRSGRVR